MTITQIVIYGLAVWRISSLLVNESGPFDVFVKFREFAGIRHDEDKRAIIIPDKLLAGILSCVWCCSIWVSFFLTAFWLASPELSLKLSVPFAMSAAAILISVLVNK